MFIVYFRREVAGCIQREPKGKKYNKCYACPVKKCTVYLDGLIRVEVDAAGLEKIRRDKFCQIKKIFEHNDGGYYYGNKE